MAGTYLLRLNPGTSEPSEKYPYTISIKFGRPRLDVAHVRVQVLEPLLTVTFSKFVLKLQLKVLIDGNPHEIQPLDLEEPRVRTLDRLIQHLQEKDQVALPCSGSPFIAIAKPIYDSHNYDSP
jgi:hypothetical protein